MTAMKTSHQRYAVATALLLLCGLAVWLLFFSKENEAAKPPASDGNGPSRLKDDGTRASAKGMKTTRTQNPDFPINDKIDLPFLGRVECHARQEKVQFTAKGKQMEWPFNVYYLPNGMFVRAEFVKPGAKDYEEDPEYLTERYRSGRESLVGFPERAAPASLGKVLQSLYEQEAFDTAGKINITWVLREDGEERIRPCFIANVFGVSPGLMRVPDDDEAFLRYRILLNPQGEAFQSDNAL